MNHTIPGTNATSVGGTVVSIAVAGVFAFSSLVLSCYLVARHLKHWTDPVGQTYIVRIVLMVPVYALSSWLSLLLAHYTIYFNLVRDCYEAFVLYQFFSLLIHYFNTVSGANIEEPGDATTAHFLSDYPRRYHPFPCCCWPPIEPGPVFLLTTKRCVLQYVVVKPLVALVAIILNLSGLYDEGSMHLNRGYVWLTLVINISVALSLYYLILFYETIAITIEREYRPLYKLLTIKLLLFFLFWQALAIDALYYFNVIPAFLIVAQHDILNNSLVCVEMFLLSVTNLWIYHYAEYRDPFGNTVETLAERWHYFVHQVMTPRDVLDDAKQTLFNNHRQ
jgi:hypothetical protein